MITYNGHNPQDLNIEYLRVNDIHQTMVRMGVSPLYPNGFMERAYNLYQQNTTALNNGQRGNSQLLNAQLGLENILDVKRVYGRM